MKIKETLIFLALLLTPALFIFKALFSRSTLVGSDAPFLFREGLHDLLLAPQTWNEWGEALGHINNAIWLYLINILYGLVGSTPGLGNDVAIRVVFFFPAIILAFGSSLVFARTLRLSKIAVLFTALLYVFNTYFLLLLDGGQVGVALAYGIFPLALMWLKKLIDKPTVNNFFVTLTLFNIHVHTDIRIATVAVLTCLIWKAFELIATKEKPKVKQFLSILCLLVASVFLNTYWIFPLVFLGAENLSTQISGLQLTSLLNSLTLFQPHWPANEFGKISPPPFYFVLLPAIWIVGQILNPSKKSLPIVLTLLVFAFLAKGTTPPLGFLYEFFLEKVPFASLFRDSTKFFIPIILFTAVLVGESVEYFSTHKNRLLSNILPIGVYAYILFLIYPAFLGQLQGALSGKPLERDYQTVAQNISRQGEQFRSAWFSSKPPFAYFSNNNPSIDARELVDKRPFASLNVGTHDSFNFLTSPLADEWLELFNIKYLFFKPNEKALKDEKQKEEWDTLINRIEENDEIKKVDWGLNIPAYELQNTKPRVFGKEKAVIVIGGEDIYDKLLTKNPDFDPVNQLFFFAEDGLFNLYDLLPINPNQASFLFNDKTELDMQMNLFNWQFVTPSAGKSQWANRNPGEYLRWKYEFLINGVNTKEFDYNKGVSFSTVTGETIKLQLSTQSEDSILAIRVLDSKDTSPLKISFNKTPQGYEKIKEDVFSWQVFEVKSQNTNTLVIENPGGFHAVNVVALIPQDAWDDAKRTTKQLLAKSSTTDIKEVASPEEEIEKIDFTLDMPTQIKVRNVKSGWLVFSSSFDNNWHVYKEDKLIGSSHPGYSAINTFYIPEAIAEGNSSSAYIPEQSDVLLRYRGQDLLGIGLVITFTTLLLLIVTFFVLKWKTISTRLRKRRR